MLCITTSPVDNDKALSIKPEFWLNRELSKVKDPKRRQWLAETVFAGADGYRKFLKVMRQRKGAQEFETGEWQTTLPKFKKSELDLKRRPCIGGCGMIIPPLFTPWGELFEDLFPICPKCKTHNKRKDGDMSEQSKPADSLTNIQEALAVIETEKQTLKADLKTVLTQAKSKLSVLLSPQLGFTFDGIFSDPEFKDIVESFKIELKRAKPQAEPAGANPRKRTTKKSEREKDKVKPGGLKAKILELMSGGKEWTRPQLKAALEKQKIKTTNLYGMSGVQGLVKDGLLTQTGKGRKAVYKVA